MEKGREMTEEKEEIEEERIDGDEEKSTSLPWGMKRTIRERGLLAAAEPQRMGESAEKNALFLLQVRVRFIPPKTTLPDEIRQI